jgi:hypothetical protein
MESDYIANDIRAVGARNDPRLNISPFIRRILSPG